MADSVSGTIRPLSKSPQFGELSVQIVRECPLLSHPSFADATELVSGGVPFPAGDEKCEDNDHKSEPANDECERIRHLPIVVDSACTRNVTTTDAMDVPTPIHTGTRSLCVAMGHSRVSREGGSGLRVI